MLKPREQCVSDIRLKIKFEKSVTGSRLAAVGAASKTATTWRLSSTVQAKGRAIARSQKSGTPTSILRATPILSLVRKSPAAQQAPRRRGSAPGQPSPRPQPPSCGLTQRVTRVTGPLPGPRHPAESVIRRPNCPNCNAAAATATPRSGCLDKGEQRLVKR